MSNKTKKKEVLLADLNSEEKGILASIERGEWRSMPNLQEEMEFAKKAASNFLRKDARINIRLSSIDLEHIKQRAVYEGVPYQTLIASILHKYAAGH